MITVENAIELILKNAPTFSKIKLPIEKCYGKVLAQDILSERDQPPFHRVAMDGVAIDFNEYQNSRREFKITGIQKAGIASLNLASSQECIEVMTGAVLPHNTNCVIRYEDTTIDGDKCIISNELVFNMMNNVHQKGSDHKKSCLLLKRGQTIYGPQVGIIASNGYSEVEVYKYPKIAVISTGDELVDLIDTPKDFQIRKSNSYALQAQLNYNGFNDVTQFHLPDEPKTLYEKLSKILESFDILVLSGGVSMGKFDFLPQIFNDLKIKKVFHKISQRPGKPLWFGVTENKAVFALPGNPVSAITCLRKYVIPSLQESMHQENLDEFVFLDSDYSFKKELTYFLPVKLYYKNAKLFAKPLTTNGSGDYGSLGNSDGFIELPKADQIFKKDHSFKLYRWS